MSPHIEDALFGRDAGGIYLIIVLEVLTAAKRKHYQIAKRMIGRYIVADPEICHGAATFPHRVTPRPRRAGGEDCARPPVAASAIRAE